MISRPFKIGLVVLLTVACGAAFALSRLDNARLRGRIAGARKQKEQTEHLQKQNERTRELVSRFDGNQEKVARAMEIEATSVRHEIAELERRAEQQRAELLSKNAQDEQSLASNRNPEIGLVRLEHFSDVGRATPAAAFQTFVSAAMKGGDQTLESMISITGEAREKANEIIAALPAADRESHGTPEKLAGLFLANALTSMASAQIVGVSLSDAQNATLTVRGLTNKEQRIPMQLAVQGWQIAVPEGMVDAIGRWAQTRPSKSK